MNNNRRSWTERITIYVGIGLAVLMGLSLVLPALDQNRNQVVTPPPVEPTATATPDYPDPITDFSSISFDEAVYLHPSGLFTIAVPTGWQPTQPFNNGVQAQANLNNPDALSVIESYLQTPNVPINSLEDLSAQFTFSSLSSSWARYTNWEELSRELDVENNRVAIDFRLSRGPENFFAQHVAWYDDDYVYVVRVVVPENATELLFYMVEQMIPTLSPLPQFRDSPLAFTAYFDETNEHILRYPQSWSVTDSAPGQPTSIEGDGVAVRVELGDAPIADEAAATAYAEGLRPGVEVTSVETITRTGGEGYSVAYTYNTPDGDAVSGLVLLLNGEDDQLHIANVIVEGTALDLNSDEAGETYADVVNSMATFSLLQGLNLWQPPAPPAPEVTPTPVVEVEATPEMEMTEEATPEATPEMEMTEEAASESTPEATEEG
ncbi:MAG: hypothetical protein RLP44_27280 [Aggregatilineales bacterium]